MADRKQRPKSTGNGTGSILEYDDEFKVQVTVYDKYGKRKRLTKGGFRTRKEAELWRWKAIELLGDEKVSTIMSASWMKL
ncbi:MAG: Arm DNA-binding domain-containing protein [Clostridia bacterium]|nr:Arm DNA-binding domain-containing protein [Clostridia bacterium]